MTKANKKDSSRPIGWMVWMIIALLASESCAPERQESIADYHQLVNRAELAICEGNFAAALDTYELAFTQIYRPFGADLYNAALAVQANGNEELRNQYLENLIDGSDDFIRLRDVFVGEYLRIEDWEKLIGNRKRDYDHSLRTAMEEVRDRDQLFRPDYGTYDDTINTIRKENLEFLISIEEDKGFPSHREIGYFADLRRQPHHIVLHHTAQRRSYDKEVMDLEPLLRRAVAQGRLDPELAILYLKFQNDPDKGTYETLTTWQYQHPLLPEKMNNAIWSIQLSNSEKAEIDELRTQWYADRVGDIEEKASYLKKSSIPFIFTSVNKSVAQLSEELTADEAVDMYLMFTDNMKIIE